MIIAVDGPTASGKGTIARALAAHFGLPHLDTGLLYRAVGMRALNDGRGVIDPHWAAELARRLDPEDLATPELRSARAGPGRRARPRRPQRPASALDVPNIPGPGSLTPMRSLRTASTAISVDRCGLLRTDSTAISVDRCGPANGRDLGCPTLCVREVAALTARP